jgi:hypothetical protein
LASHHRGHSAAIWAFVAPGPRWRAAIVQSESPRWTTCGAPAAGAEVVEGPGVTGAELCQDVGLLVGAELVAGAALVGAALAEGDVLGAPADPGEPVVGGVRFGQPLAGRELAELMIGLAVDDAPLTSGVQGAGPAAALGVGAAVASVGSPVDVTVVVALVGEPFVGRVFVGRALVGRTLVELGVGVLVDPAVGVATEGDGPGDAAEPVVGALGDAVDGVDVVVVEPDGLADGVVVVLADGLLPPTPSGFRTNAGMVIVVGESSGVGVAADAPAGGGGVVDWASAADAGAAAASSPVAATPPASTATSAGWSERRVCLIVGASLRVEGSSRGLLRLTGAGGDLPP